MEHESIFDNKDPNHMSEINQIQDVEILDPAGNHIFDYVFKVITIGDPCKF